MSEGTIGEYRVAAQDYLFRANVEADAIARLDTIGYWEAPASMRHHLAEPGGLVRHSVNVTRWLLKLTTAGFVSWEYEHSPYRIGMFHDLVKCACYEIDPLCGRDEPIRYAYRQSGYVGHGTASAIIAMSGLGVQLSAIEVACICHHMGAYNLDKNQLAELNAALRLYPAEIIATHAADMMAAKVSEENRRILT